MGDGSGKVGNRCRRVKGEVPGRLTRRQFEESGPDFAVVLDRLGLESIGVAQPGEADSRINRTLYTQPGLFALQIGLVARWRAWGFMSSRPVLPQARG